MDSSPTHHPALYTVQDIRRIEAKELAEQSEPYLMQRAGLAAAALAARLIRHKKTPVLIIAGPGNNGGDALETAANLASAGFAIQILLCGDPLRYPDDAKRAYQRLSSIHIPCIPYTDRTSIPAQNWGLFIDGLFGIGLRPSIAPALQDLILYINTYSAQHQVPVLALDIPSGLNADTGSTIDEASGAIVASHTLSFIADKPGLHTADGKDLAGAVTIDSLAIAADKFPPTTCHLNWPDFFRQRLIPRKQNSHKGSYGNVCIIGGASGMTGAALLAARTSLLAGAGKVFIGFADQVLACDLLHPEIMCRHASDIVLHDQTIVIGPGLGDSAYAQSILDSALTSHCPLIIDADALNLIARENRFQEQLKRRQANTILTPHPLEAARLLRISVKEVQHDRLQAARTLAATTNSVVILKGAGSIIANPTGEIRINTSGNPGLASGGTGDVLAGLCGALNAQGMNSFDGACLATYLHGTAADTLATQGTGPVGLSASELPPQIRSLLNAQTIQPDRT